jgi:branched-subunit amino acid transport protein
MDRDLYVWISIAGLMLITFLTRAGLIIWSREFVLPRRLQRALRFAPMAAIVAIIVPSVFFTQGQFDVSMTNPRLPAILAGFAAWWFTRQMAVCMAVGLATYGLARLLLQI